MTHDLLREVVHALGASLEAVHITEMRDGIYIAELLFGDERTVSARPSDAVALAVRTGAPIYGAEALLDEVGRSEEHTSELQSHVNLVCRLLLEKKKKKTTYDASDT